MGDSVGPDSGDRMRDSVDPSAHSVDRMGDSVVPDNRQADSGDRMRDSVDPLADSGRVGSGRKKSKKLRYKLETKSFHLQLVSSKSDISRCPKSSERLLEHIGCNSWQIGKCVKAYIGGSHSSYPGRKTG